MSNNDDKTGYDEPKMGNYSRPIIETPIPKQPATVGFLYPKRGHKYLYCEECHRHDNDQYFPMLLGWITFSPTILNNEGLRFRCEGCKTIYVAKFNECNEVRISIEE